LGGSEYYVECGGEKEREREKMKSVYLDNLMLTKSEKTKNKRESLEREESSHSVTN
jgi:hypothetical protein